MQQLRCGDVGVSKYGYMCINKSEWWLTDRKFGAPVALRAPCADDLTARRPAARVLPTPEPSIASCTRMLQNDNGRGRGCAPVSLLLLKRSCKNE